MVHPFHPWFERDLEFVKRRRNWRADRVYVLGDAGELVSLPAEWTDLAPADPFVVVAAGRAPFRTADLLKLADEVARLRSGADGVPEDSAVNVHGILSYTRNGASRIARLPCGDRRSGAAAKAEFDARWQELRVAPHGSTDKGGTEGDRSRGETTSKGFPAQS